MINGVLDVPPRGDGGHLPRQRQGPYHPHPQSGGGVQVHPAGAGGQVDHQRALLEGGQLLHPQHRGGHGVKHQVVAAQPVGEAVHPLAAQAHALGGGPLLVPPGGHPHVGTQGPQAGGQGLAQPPEADDQDPGVVEGDGQLLQGDLNGPLSGGNCVGHCQLLPRKVVV